MALVRCGFADGDFTVDVIDAWTCRDTPARITSEFPRSTKYCIPCNKVRCIIDNRCIFWRPVTLAILCLDGGVSWQTISVGHSKKSNRHTRGHKSLQCAAPIQSRKRAADRIVGPQPFHTTSYSNDDVQSSLHCYQMV